MTITIVADGTEFPLITEPTAKAAPRFLVVLERGDQGWGAYAPDLPGVVAAGSTEDEVRSLINEAVEFHLEGLREANLEIPIPASQPLWVNE